MHELSSESGSQYPTICQLLYTTGLDAGATSTNYQSCVQIHRQTAVYREDNNFCREGENHFGPGSRDRWDAKNLMAAVTTATINHPRLIISLFSVRLDEKYA